KSGQAGRTRLQALTGSLAAASMDRRAFLRRSGITAGSLAALGGFQLGTVKAADISHPEPGVPIELKKSICTHCSVGCTVTAEIQNGVWTGQEPSWDSPFNRGSHCAKGASVRELVHSDRRLKYPDRKSTRLNSSHVKISYAVFCLKKKNITHRLPLQ